MDFLNFDRIFFFFQSIMVCCHFLKRIEKFEFSSFSLLFLIESYHKKLLRLFTVFRNLIKNIIYLSLDSVFLPKKIPKYTKYLKYLSNY